MATKIIAAVAAVAVLAGGGVVAAKSIAARRESRTEPPAIVEAYNPSSGQTGQSAESGGDAAPLDERAAALAAYETVLGDYRAAMSSGDAAAYPQLNAEYLEFYFRNKPSGPDEPYAELDYCYYDLNGDGTDELFLAYGWMYKGECMESGIFELYAFDGERAVPLLGGETFWNVFEGGYIETHRGNGGSAMEVYQLLPGATELTKTPYTDNPGRFINDELHYTDILSSGAGAPQDAKTDAYEQAKTALLEEWSELLAMDSVPYSTDGYAMPEIPYNAAVIAIGYGREPIYWAEFDFDGNGVDEIVIAQPSDYGTYFLGVYAFDGTQMRYVFREHPLGERVQMVAYFPEEKTMMIHGSGGAQSGAEFFYRFAPDGYTLETVLAYSWDGVNTANESFVCTVGETSFDEVKQRWSQPISGYSRDWFRDNLDFRLISPGGAQPGNIASSDALDARKAYEALLGDYRRGAAGEWVSNPLIDFDFAATQNSLNDMTGEMVCEYESLEFALVDLNGDGVEELVFRLRSHYSMADDPSMSWDEEFFPEVYTYSGGKAVKLLNGMFITNVLDDGRLMCLGMNYGALDLYELPAHGSALDHVGDYRKPVSFS